MADPNSITIRGRLTADPELRKTPNGASVANFTIATNSLTRTKSGSWEDGPTTFWDCTAWARMADNIAASLTKGTQVIACVTPNPQTYENKEGQTVHKLAWTVTDIAASMMRATLSIHANQRTSQALNTKSTYQRSSYTPQAGTDPWDAAGNEI